MTHLIRSLLLVAVLVLSVVPAAPAQTLSAGAPQDAQSGQRREAPPISVTDPVPDDRLQERIRQAFSAIEGLDEVGVRVNEGVVQLSGTTLRAEMRERAETLARRFEGVVYVENNIEAETDVGNRLTPAVQTMREYLDAAVAYLPLVGVAILVLLLFGLLARLVWLWKAPYERFGINPLVHSWIRRLLWVFTFLIGVVVALNILDASAVVGIIFGTAGIVGLAIGFAFQDIAENYLAGALLSLRQPFAPNDLVVIGENEGKVVRLTAREVVLMTLDGNHVSLPNSTVFKSVITNFTRNPRRRFAVVVGIGVDESPPEAIAVGIEALQALEGVMDEPEPFALVQEIGDSSVIIHFFGWVDQRGVDFLKVRSKAVRVVKAALDEAEIELPEPIYSIRMRPEMIPERTGEARSEQTDAAKRSAEAANRDTDISVDTHLDEQIQEDRRHSDEPDLLQE